ncbi:hypothetical protein DYB32_000509 [Aphanomyces invadans]|uniref:Uncharacterized protein n=1 Tax=Aphanomyces invadans TaxID=157072 RepID=A0A418B9W8_9STRA|nr:hypothetical protein DYB32_000509 [Aphanomyces invadans]
MSTHPCPCHAANDYSMWDKWEPKDPVTLEEKARQDALVEKMKNDEFEKANPAFCTQFKEDLEKRQKSTRDKERVAQSNASFKRRQYAAALTSYMAALVESPYCPLILTNIAQVHLRLHATDDALEFCNRALFVAPTHIKALSRKAAILHGRGNLQEAYDLVRKAVDLDPTSNPDLMQQLVQIKASHDDDVGRAALQRQMDGPKSLDNWHLHAMQHLLGQLNLMECTSEAKVAPSQDTTNNEACAEPAADHTQKKSVSCLATDTLRALLPLLQADKDCKLLFRTSGALTRLCDRLLVPETIDDTEVNAILECLVAMVHDDAATQHHLFLLVPFRQWVVRTVADTVDNAWSRSTMSLVLQLVDECMAVNLWKSLVATSTPMLAGLLGLWQPHASPVAQYATSIIFHVSETEAGRLTLTTALIQPVLKQVLALLHTQLATEQLTAGLGVVLNLTNHCVFRQIVASEADVPHEMTKALVHLLTLPDAIIAERTLAILLNLSLDPQTCIRQDMLAAHVHERVLVWLERDTLAGTTPFLLALWRVFESTLDHPCDCWQLRAQLLCHMAWSFPATTQFMDEHACVRRMLQFMQGKRASVPKDQIAAFERTVTNCTKCWIAMLAVDGGRSTVAAIIESNGLELLVDWMSHMKDEKIARKNVAILLAKLCQRSDAIKERVRALRGIEMMLSICRNLKG